MYMWDENNRNTQTQHQISFDLVTATSRDVEKLIVIGTYEVLGQSQVVGRSFSRRDFCLRWWKCVGVFSGFDVLEWDFSSSGKSIAHVRGSGWFGVSFEEDARGMFDGRMKVSGWELSHVGGGRWELC